nr:MAG TPA: hypothetical protein [Caudoviricetes sp.]
MKLHCSLYLTSYGQLPHRDHFLSCRWGKKNL